MSYASLPFPSGLTASFGQHVNEMETGRLSGRFLPAGVEWLWLSAQGSL